MRKEEFLKQLEFLLNDIPQEERIAAMEFYRSYFEDAGKTYHHILDPKTGYPVENDLVSVSVVSGEA